MSTARFSRSLRGGVTRTCWLVKAADLPDLAWHAFFGCRNMEDVLGKVCSRTVLPTLPVLQALFACLWERQLECCGSCRWLLQKPLSTHTSNNKTGPEKRRKQAIDLFSFFRVRSLGLMQCNRESIRPLHRCSPPASVVKPGQAGSRWNSCKEISMHKVEALIGQRINN